METQIQEGIQVPSYEIIRIPDSGEEGRDALKQQCLDLRIEVFVNEQGFPLDTEIDEFEFNLILLVMFARYPKLIISYFPITWSFIPK